MSYKHKTKICSVPECDEPVHCLDVCAACYQRMRYWHDRPLKDKARRMKQIRRCESSLQMQMGNVRAITTAKKTRRQA